MRSKTVGAGTLKPLGRVALTAALCFLMIDQPLLGAQLLPAESATKTSPTPGQLQGDQRVLHALNRLTFGPRPGDLAAVEKMGLNRWFEAQLNPGSIDDSALDARLAQYPATLMPLAALQRKYPGPAQLRQMENGKLALPSDPTERAMVNDQLAFYEMNQKAAGKVAPVGTETAAAAPMKNKQRKVQSGMDAVAETMNEGQGGAPEKPLPATELASDGTLVPVPAAEQMTPAAVQGILGLAPDQRLQAILNLPPKDLVRLRGSLRGPQLAALTDGMTPQQRETLQALPGSLRMVALESLESRLDRDLYSNRQLEAVMTDFWLNHFSVYVRKNQNEPYLLASYERETIRPHALGKFEDLLVATAESPAMLQYLDNFRSVGPDSMAATRLQQVQKMRPNAKLAKQGSAGLNENYGRELMELHTLGVNGGYTQADVTNVSKVFTGWTIDKPYQGGGFSFDERRHEPGLKVVLGKTIPEDGQKEGLEVLHMLASSPATARFISQKLAVRFVADDPPASLVDKMAASYLKSDGDIKTVLRTMFAAPEFWSPAVYRAKVKTPLEFVVSAARASALQVASTQALVQSLDKLGMPLYGMQTPNGDSWKQDEWVSTGALVSRMNFALVMSGDRLPGTRTEWMHLLGEAPPQSAVMPAAYVPETAEVKERRLEKILLGTPVSERTRATVLSQSGDANVTEQAATQFDLRAAGGKGNYAARGLGRPGAQAGPDDPQAAVMAGLLLGSPEFQRR